MSTPSELKYTKDHEWIKIENNVATIGITDFAQGELGRHRFCRCRFSRRRTKRRRCFRKCRSSKTVSDLYLPVSGKVIEFNEALEDEPELVNTDPYGKGWIIKLEISADADQSELLTAEQYQELIG